MSYIRDTLTLQWLLVLREAHSSHNVQAWPPHLILIFSGMSGPSWPPQKSLGWVLLALSHTSILL